MGEIVGELGRSIDVLRECGRDVQPLPDGTAHIDVPYMPDTMPDGVSPADLFALALRGRF